MVGITPPRMIRSVGVHALNNRRRMDLLWGGVRGVVA
jgi:hypothetical protein